MKRSLFILMAAVAVMTASAQHMVVRTYLEKTHVSPKAGTAIGFENHAGIEFGGFYQKSTISESFTVGEDKQNNLPRFYEKELYGAYISVPIRSTSRLDLKFNVRTGVANQQNFVITPSILASYKPMRFIRLGLGVGSRSFRPTMQSSISFVLN